MRRKSRTGKNLSRRLRDDAYVYRRRCGAYQWMASSDMAIQHDASGNVQRNDNRCSRHVGSANGENERKRWSRSGKNLG